MNRHQHGRWLVVIGLSVLLSGFSAPEHKRSHAHDAFGNIKVNKLIVMPNSSGHSDWVDAINGATKSVHMTMYHITDAAMVTALLNKAKDTSVDLKVIVDGGSLTGGYKTVFSQLSSGGVNIRASSNAFSLTHSKDVVIDGQTAIIGAINMTNTTTNTRDFAIITPDAGIISEVESVFAADWTNATNNGSVTPSLSNPNLAWSPVNADKQLLALINMATSTIDAETESFTSSDIITALNQAAARGVTVRLIVPECDLGNGTLDYPYLAQLKGVNVHVEHDGDSIQQPYMHSKMMIVDGQTMYIGSINFSTNSIQNDRELGVIFDDPATSTQLATEYETDWNRSQAPAATPNCPANTPAPQGH